MKKAEKQEDKIDRYDHLGFKTEPVNEEHGGHEHEIKETITKGGNHNIEIDLDSKMLAQLVDIWATENLHEASLELYTDTMFDTGNQHNALHAAVTNDVMINILKEELDRVEADDAENV